MSGQPGLHPPSWLHVLVSAHPKRCGGEAPLARGPVPAAVTITSGASQPFLHTDHPELIQFCINEQPDFRETGPWVTSLYTRPHLACPTARPESKGPAALWTLALVGPHPSCPWSARTRTCRAGPGL